eukprot:jgi/Orpsp1_1/1175338/evm.model.c7180000053445.1
MFIITIILIDYVTSKIILNALAFVRIKNYEIPSLLTNEFNEYSERNNLNITINLILITPDNSTKNEDDFCSFLDFTLKRKTTKYDIIFYNNVYIQRFEDHFIDLYKLLPENHIQMFKNIRNYEVFFLNNKLIGLPGYIYFSIIYNNIKLLNKYNRNIPKTWDELLETGKYIMKNEEKQNNTDILIYNGLFAYDELGTSSLYEFIHSYRDNINDPIPNFRSQNALKALKMIKKLKIEISLDKYYQDIGYTTQALTDGNGLFIKSNHVKIPTDNIFKASVLPGHYEGISSTFIGGDNISINKNIDKEKIDASVTALIYMTSKEVQKKMIFKFNVFSGIHSLYEDKELCNKTDFCDIYKNLQTVVKPISKTNNYLEYSRRIRKYIYNYLYGDDDVDPEEMLKMVDNITRIYYISWSPNSSFFEKFIVGLYLLLIFSSIILGIYLYILKCKNHDHFFSKSHWSFIFIGHLLLVLISFIDIQKVTIFRCYLKLFFQFISFTLMYIPVLYKMVAIFPEKNKIMQWITKNPHSFIFLFIIIDLLTFGLMNIQPYKIKTFMNIEDKIFQKCKIGGILSWILLTIITLFKFIIFWIILFFLIIEWHIKPLYYDIRFFISLFSIDSIIFIILISFDFLDIKHANLYFLTHELLIILIPISNYILYFVRVFFFNIDKDRNLNKNYSSNNYPKNSNANVSPSSEVNCNSEFVSSLNMNNNSNDNIKNYRKKSLKHYLQAIKFNNKNEIQISKSSGI